MFRRNNFVGLAGAIETECMHEGESLQRLLCSLEQRWHQYALYVDVCKLLTVVLSGLQTQNEWCYMVVI